MRNERISLEALRSKLQKPTRIRNGKFMACCPCHRDSKPSLSVAEKNGLILLHCHGGCEYEEIRTKLELLPGQLGSGPSKTMSQGEICYDYKNEAGELSYQVVRTPGKIFSCRRPTAAGGYERNLNGVARILYHMPEIAAARTKLDAGPQMIFICEGEKDVETLTSEGLLATCNPHGAGNWKNQYVKEFKGFDCVILPDNDDPGKAHAETVAQSLVGVAKTIKVVELPGLTDKGDITDWLNDGHTANDLLGLVEKTPAWATGITVKTPRRMQLTPVKDLLAEEEETVEYIWDQLMPVAGVSILSGKPKLGKTTIARNLALSISRGDPFLGRGTTQGTVFMFSLEDIRAQVKLSFEKHKAVEEPILICTRVDTERFIDDLKFEIAQHGAALIVIDPMSRVVREPDFNDYAKMTQALEPFVDLAREFRVHVLLLHHDNKTKEGSDGLLGSTAIFGAVDTHFQVARRDGSERTLKSTNRYGDPLEETVLSFDAETGIITTATTLRGLRALAVEEKVLDSMSEGEKLLEMEIKRRVKGSAGGVSRAIRSLHSKGMIKRRGGGVKGDPLTYEKISALFLPSAF